MPLLNVKLSGEPDPRLTQEITDNLLRLTSSILNKDPALTAIIVEYVLATQWSIAGKPLTTLSQTSFSLEIKITDETNTKAQKADYVKAVFALFSKLLNNIADESYIYINDVRATAFSYAGVTQEHRYHNVKR